MKYEAQPRDELGSRKGTLAAHVNAAVKPQWQTVAEIAAEAGLPAKAVQMRLYRGAKLGIYEYERIIRFRLKRKKK